MKPLLIVSCLIVWANVAAATETDFRLSSQWQWQHGDIIASPDNNPNNTIFNLAEDTVTVELKPTFDLNWQQFSLQVDPRFHYLARENDNNLGSESSEANLRYVKLEYQQSQVSAAIGKYLQLWGPSVIFSPSNRYHNDNGRTDPSSELLAREFVEADWFINDHWDLQLVANVGEGDQEPENFKRSGDLRLSWLGNAVTTTLQTSWMNPGWGVGGLAQWTVNDGLLVYADGLYAPFQTVDNYLESLNNLNNEVDIKPNQRRLKLVSGLSYTFANGTTFALDYYYNGTGLSGNKSTDKLRASINAVSQLLQGNTDPNLSEQVRQLNTLPFFNLSNRYAVARLSHSELLDKLSASFIVINNLADHSHQDILSIDCECTNSMSVYLTASHFHGDSLTEFGRFYSNQFSLGLRWVMY